MQKYVTMRLTLSVDEKTVFAVKDFSGKRKRPISSVFELGAQMFLKAEGAWPERFEDKETELFDMIREILASGHTAEEINKHLLSLGRKDVA